MLLLMFTPKKNRRYFYVHLLLFFSTGCGLGMILWSGLFEVFHFFTDHVVSFFVWCLKVRLLIGLKWSFREQPLFLESHFDRALPWVASSGICIKSAGSKVLPKLTDSSLALVIRKPFTSKYIYIIYPYVLYIKRGWGKPWARIHGFFSRPCLGTSKSLNRWVSTYLFHPLSIFCKLGMTKVVLRESWDHWKTDKGPSYSRMSLRSVANVVLLYIIYTFNLYNIFIYFFLQTYHTYIFLHLPSF